MAQETQLKSAVSATELKMSKLKISAPSRKNSVKSAAPTTTEPDKQETSTIVIHRSFTADGK